MFFCNYDIVRNNDSVAKIRSGACFRQIYTNHLVDDNKQISIYISKDSKPYIDYLKRPALTEEEYRLYFAALNEIGFKNTVEDGTFKTSSDFYGKKEGNTYEALKITCNLKEYTNNQALLFLNLVRHSYEQPFVDSVRFFVSLLPDKTVRVTKMDRLIMSLTKINSLGHTFCSNMRILIDKAKVENAFFKLDTKMSTVFTARTSRIVPQTELAFIEDSKITLTQKKKKYKELCAKYM